MGRRCNGDVRADKPKRVFGSALREAAERDSELDAREREIERDWAYRLGEEF
jgi:hypothetical protein